MEQPILVLMGPTAVGKTELSLAIAQELGAEIISVDSRQIYKGLDIGTAKPEAAERQLVRHHFIDELDPSQHLSAGRFAEAANQRIAEIYGRSKTPLVVGGSTLYLSALLHGISQIPATDPEVRTALTDRLNRAGAATLYRELEQVDPISAGTMDATKSQRIVRALEVYYSTGRPISSFHARKEGPKYEFIPVVLTRDRAALYGLINARVDLMLDLGLVREVEQLLEQGYSPTLPALRSIGYGEIIRFLQGEIPKDEAVNLIKRNSRRYAKRQLTWFRRYEEYRWLDLDSGIVSVEYIISLLQ